MTFGQLISKTCTVYKKNKGFNYLLTVIDLFSKYAYTIPLKSKNSDGVISAFKKLFKTRKPAELWTDQGSEFINRNFKTFLEQNNIQLYHIFNEGKANVIERFNQTLGEMIQKHMTNNKQQNILMCYKKYYINTTTNITRPLK